MKSEIFKYPKQIYNEELPLNIYKKEFPGIEKEYEEIVKKSYLNPKAFKVIVRNKSKVFDKNFNDLVKKYQKIKKDLDGLVQFYIEMHRNYAFNFWLISYAICDGPLAVHYSQEIEKVLKKLFLDKNELNKAREILIRTDYEIFYHKIVKESVEMYKFLSQFVKLEKLFAEAKRRKSKKSRQQIWNKLLNALRKDKRTKLFMKQFSERWEDVLNLKDETLFYVIIDEAVDNYEANIEKIKELKRVKKQIKDILSLADKKLPKKEAERLRSSYLLIREMLLLKDSIFGKKDIKLFAFWLPIKEKIISQFQKEYKVEVSSEDKSFLLIPWSLRKYKKRR